MLRLALLRAVTACVLALWSAMPAHSGAWPRGDGNVFLSFHATQNPDDWQARPAIAAYLEYGLSDVWTLGAKVEYDLEREDVSMGELFARWHFAGPWQTAISLTVAGLEDEDIRLLPAFHIGRGFDTRWGGGWTDLVIKADLPLNEGDKALGFVGQFGLKPHDRWMTMLSLDVHASEAGVFTKLIPAMAWQIKPDRHLHLEWSETVDPTPQSKLSLGLWMAF